MAEHFRPKALFLGFESDEFNALVLEAARTNFDVTPMLGDVPIELFQDQKWDAVVFAFTPEHAQTNTIQSVVASYPNSFYYFVYPKGVDGSDITRFVHGFLNSVTDRRKVGTIEYFIAESTQHVSIQGAMGVSSSHVVGKGGSVIRIPDELSITFDPSLSAEQIEIALTALADYYRACGGAGLPADFESQEALVLEDANV